MEPSTRSSDGQLFPTARPCCGFRARLVWFPLIFLTLCWPVQLLLIRGLNQCEGGNVGTLNQVVRGSLDAQILISGSSRAVYHFDPRIIERHAGKKTFNIGRDGTKLDEQLALLKTYLRHHSKPECVIQNLDGFSLRANDGVTDPMQYMGSLKEPELYQAAVSQRRYFMIYRYFPLVGFVREGAIKPAIQGLLGISDAAENRFQGYRPQNLTWTSEFATFKKQHASGVEWPVDAGGRQALQGIMELCQKEGIKLVLVYSPEYIESQLLTRNRSEIFNAFHSMANAFQAPVWDYSQDPISADKNCFYNSQHLNQNGASLFSEKVGNRLANYYYSNPSLR